ncbi:hypothetical protein R1flu_021012 [Riccia fluitans]|uniref:Uncharacterized protein n=1 Tax=Riccia fluitans TaxID=41844 RepID=A0ABD1ZRK3_9MARC
MRVYYFAFNSSILPSSSQGYISLFGTGCDEGEQKRICENAIRHSQGVISCTRSRRKLKGSPEPSGKIVPYEMFRHTGDTVAGFALPPPLFRQALAQTDNLLTSIVKPLFGLNCFGCSPLVFACTAVPLTSWSISSLYCVNV